MLDTSRLHGFMHKNDFVKVYAYDFGSSASGATTYSFTNLTGGTETTTLGGQNRILLPFISGIASASRTISSVSVNSVAASSVANVGGSTQHPCGFYQVENSSDATGITVDVTFSGAMLRASCMLFSLSDLESTTALSTMTASGADPMSGSIDLYSGGMMLAATASNATTFASVTWSPITSEIESAGSSTYASGRLVAAARTQIPYMFGPGGTITLSCDWDGGDVSGSLPRLVAVSYR